MFCRSQFWRLQKPNILGTENPTSFIGHNFGDYKNNRDDLKNVLIVLSVTILETTKTIGRVLSSFVFVLSVTILETTKTERRREQQTYRFYRSQFWRLQKPQMVSANYTIKVRSYSS